MRSIVTPLGLATFVALGLSCLGLALAPRASAGACAMPRVVMELVPTLRDAIPSDQGILLRAGTDPRRAVGDAPERFSDDAVRLEAHLEREGQASIALAVEPVGPSLARLVPASAPAAGVWRLVSGTASHEVRFAAGPARSGPPSAPRVTSIVRRQASIPGPRGSDDYLSVTARLRGGLPRDASGAILFLHAGARDRALLSQSRAALEGASLVLFQAGGRCAVLYPGQQPPRVGADVYLAAYDRFGRVGAQSTVVQVTEESGGQGLPF